MLIINNGISFLGGRRKIVTKLMPGSMQERNYRFLRWMGDGVYFPCGNGSDPWTFSSSSIFSAHSLSGARKNYDVFSNWRICEKPSHSQQKLFPMKTIHGGSRNNVVRAHIQEEIWTVFLLSGMPTEKCVAKNIYGQCLAVAVGCWVCRG